MYRTIDANLNRTCEGLRVIEDFLRFELTCGHADDINFLKEARHFLREKIKNYNSKILSCRDAETDIGKGYTKTESNRNSRIDLVQANFYRIEEGLRVLEESAKINSSIGKFTAKIKEIRFKIYTVEKKIIGILSSKKINLTNYLILDLTSLKFNEMDTILENIIKMKITSLALTSAEINLRYFYKKVHYFKKKCNNMPLIIKNNLDIAIVADFDGILITDEYLPFTELAKKFDKSMGFLINKKQTAAFFNDIRIDYFLLNQENNFNNVKKRALWTDISAYTKNQKMLLNSALYKE